MARHLTQPEQEFLKVQALTDVLNIKLIETLREDLGGIYSGGMYGNMSKESPYNSYSLGGIVALRT